MNIFDIAVARLKHIDKTEKDPYQKALRTGTLTPWYAWELYDYSLRLKEKESVSKDTFAELTKFVIETTKKGFTPEIVMALVRPDTIKIKCHSYH